MPTDETTTDGGVVIPHAALESMYDFWIEPNPFRSLLPPSPPRPWHRRLRTAYLMKRDRAIGWLHDRLFGSNYCDHDGCY